MGVKFCPKCGSEKIVMIVPEATLWKCVDCGYTTSIFPEKDKNFNIKSNEKRRNKK